MDKVCSWKEYDKKYIAWQKQFVSGAQSTMFNACRAEAECLEKQYYWQEHKVFNFLKPLIDGCRKNVSSYKLWGTGKIVDQLIPYQQEYNNMMNCASISLVRLAQPIINVEDGSVDVDDLCEEGLAPGKVLVYRQGSECPSIQPLVDISTVKGMYDIAQTIKQECIDLFNTLVAGV